MQNILYTIIFFETRTEMAKIPGSNFFLKEMCKYKSNYMSFFLTYTEYHWVFEKSRRIYARIHPRLSKNRLLAA